MGEDPEQWRKFFVFQKIPYLKMAGVALPGRTQLETCQAYCANHGDCKSISYSKSKELCLWSELAITFHPGFNAYIKYAQAGSGTRFQLIAGMAYVNKAATAQSALSFSECKLKCYMSKTCYIFSHSKTSNTCIIAGEDLGYDDEFDYFGKAAVMQLHDAHTASKSFHKEKFVKK